MKKYFCLFLALKIACAAPILAQTKVKTESSGQQFQIIENLGDNKEEKNTPSRESRFLKGFGLFLGFAIMLTVGLVLSDHNEGKRAHS